MPLSTGRRHVGIAAVAAILAVLPVAGALAIQGVGVSPTNQTVDVVPGASTTGQLTAINDGDSEVVYRVYATDYKVDNEDYQGDFTSSNASADTSAVSWFKVPTGDFTIKPHDQMTVPYTITVPKTAAVGGHYAAIFIETVPPPILQGTVVSRIERLGSIFYITVDGNLINKGSIQSLSAKLYQSASPLSGILRVRNDGNVHFLVQGTAQLSTVFGKSGKAVAFGGEVLPGTVRRFNLSLPSAPVGLYKLTANVTYLGHTEKISHYVFIMPIVTLAIILATIIVLVGLLVWRTIRKRRRSRD